jgi:hypothetical protein
MRTTLTLEAELVRELKALARERNAPFEEVVENALRAGLEHLRAVPPSRRFRATTFRMGTPTGVNLDKALDLAAQRRGQGTGTQDASAKMILVREPPPPHPLRRSSSSLVMRSPVMCHV